MRSVVAARGVPAPGAPARVVLNGKPSTSAAARGGPAGHDLRSRRHYQAGACPGSSGVAPRGPSPACDSPRHRVLVEFEALANSRRTAATLPTSSSRTRSRRRSGADPAVGRRRSGPGRPGDDRSIPPRREAKRRSGLGTVVYDQDVGDLDPEIGQGSDTQPFVFDPAGITSCGARSRADAARSSA